MWHRPDSNRVVKRPLGMAWWAAVAIWCLVFNTASDALVLVKLRSPQRLASFSVFLCHSGSESDPAADGEAPATGQCCLLCQAAQMATGAAPPQHFTHPTASAELVRHAISPGILSREVFAWHKRARAPPAFAAV